MSKRKGNNKKKPGTIYHPKQRPKVPNLSGGVDPSSSANRTPSWSFNRMDLSPTCPWNWQEVESRTLLLEIVNKLAQYESMTWASIAGDRNHFIGIGEIIKPAQERLKQLRLHDVDQLFSLHLSGTQRVWGIRDNAVLRILWWDPKHEVCPSNKKNT